MSSRVSMQELGAAIERELTIYAENVTDAVNDEGRKAMKELVRQTKATAPVGKSGTFKRNIAMKETQEGRNMKRYTWYVKAPDYRLTHLIVHGHATKDGGRTRANPFLRNAVDRVLPEYEEKIKEAIRNG